MNLPFGNHKFFFAYEFPIAVNVTASDTITVGDFTKDREAAKYRGHTYPYLRAALIQRAVAAGQTDGFKSE